jgi:hypothetical protein
MVLVTLAIALIVMALGATYLWRYFRKRRLKRRMDRACRRARYANDVWVDETLAWGKNDPRAFDAAQWRKGTKERAVETTKEYLAYTIIPWPRRRVE